MTWFYFCLCAFLFSAGDYLCSLDGLRVLEGGRSGRVVTTVLGALVGAVGYAVFSYLSRNTPLSALAAYINGAVVVLSSVFFGYLIQGNRVHASEWIWMAVIVVGILGLAYSRSGV